MLYSYKSLYGSDEAGAVLRALLLEASFHSRHLPISINIDKFLAIFPLRLPGNF
jgi:hypothetical protein